MYDTMLFPSSDVPPIEAASGLADVNTERDVTTEHDETARFTTQS